ncbi:MAG: hypothetical protein FWG75_10630 [Cystobacterineae bacterium]|nr:hypothetical protein [Cystobacterineae bacterium]
MDALELKTSEDMDTESITIGVRYASTFEIPVTQEVVDAIEATDKWNPELSLKSIRIISPSDTKYSLTEIDMVLYPPLPTSSLPAISIVDNELPISNWPENQIYVPTKPINIIDYLSEGGTFMAEISLITELSLHAPWVGIEVCMDAKISSSVSILF